MDIKTMVKTEKDLFHLIETETDPDKKNKLMDEWEALYVEIQFLLKMDVKIALSTN